MKELFILFSFLIAGVNLSKLWVTAGSYAGQWGGVFTGGPGQVECLVLPLALHYSGDKDGRHHGVGEWGHQL